MTAEEKKELRRLRHELHANIRRGYFGKEVLLTATNGQLKAWSKQVADKFLAGKDPQKAQPLSR